MYVRSMMEDATSLPTELLPTQLCRAAAASDHDVYKRRAVSEEDTGNTNDTGESCLLLVQRNMPRSVKHDQVPSLRWLPLVDTSPPANSVPCGDNKTQKCLRQLSMVSELEDFLVAYPRTDFDCFLLTPPYQTGKDLLLSFHAHLLMWLSACWKTLSHFRVKLCDLLTDCDLNGTVFEFLKDGRDEAKWQRFMTYTSAYFSRDQDNLIALVYDLAHPTTFGSGPVPYTEDYYAVGIERWAKDVTMVALWLHRCTWVSRLRTLSNGSDILLNLYVHEGWSDIGDGVASSMCLRYGMDVINFALSELHLPIEERLSFRLRYDNVDDAECSRDVDASNVMQNNLLLMSSARRVQSVRAVPLLYQVAVSKGLCLSGVSLFELRELMKLWLASGKFECSVAHGTKVQYLQMACIVPFQAKESSSYNIRVPCITRACAESVIRVDDMVLMYKVVMDIAKEAVCPQGKQWVIDRYFFGDIDRARAWAPDTEEKQAFSGCLVANWTIVIADINDAIRHRNDKRPQMVRLTSPIDPSARIEYMCCLVMKSALKVEEYMQSTASNLPFASDKDHWPLLSMVVSKKCLQMHEDKSLIVEEVPWGFPIVQSLPGCMVVCTRTGHDFRSDKLTPEYLKAVESAFESARGSNEPPHLVESRVCNQRFSSLEFTNASSLSHMDLCSCTNLFHFVDAMLSTTSQFFDQPACITNVLKAMHGTSDRLPMLLPFRRYYEPTVDGKQAMLLPDSVWMDITRQESHEYACALLSLRKDSNPAWDHTCLSRLNEELLPGSVLAECKRDTYDGCVRSAFENFAGDLNIIMRRGWLTRIYPIESKTVTGTSLQSQESQELLLGLGRVPKDHSFSRGVILNESQIFMLAKPAVRNYINGWIPEGRRSPWLPQSKSMPSSIPLFLSSYFNDIVSKQMRAGSFAYKAQEMVPISLPYPMDVFVCLGLIHVVDVKKSSLEYFDDNGTVVREANAVLPLLIVTSSDAVTNVFEYLKSTKVPEGYTFANLEFARSVKTVCESVVGMQQSESYAFLRVQSYIYGRFTSLRHRELLSNMMTFAFAEAPSFASESCLLRHGYHSDCMPCFLSAMSESSDASPIHKEARPEAICNQFNAMDIADRVVIFRAFYNVCRIWSTYTITEDLQEGVDAYLDYLEKMDDPKVKDKPPEPPPLPRFTSTTKAGVVKDDTDAHVARIWELLKKQATRHIQQETLGAVREVRAVQAEIDHVEEALQSAYANYQQAMKAVKDAPVSKEEKKAAIQAARKRKDEETLLLKTKKRELTARLRQEVSVATNNLYETVIGRYARDYSIVMGIISMFFTGVGKTVPTICLLLPRLKKRLASFCDAFESDFFFETNICHPAFHRTTGKTSMHIIAKATALFSGLLHESMHSATGMGRLNEQTYSAYRLDDVPHRLQLRMAGIVAVRSSKEKQKDHLTLSLHDKHSDYPPVSFLSLPVERVAFERRRFEVYEFLPSKCIGDTCNYEYVCDDDSVVSTLDVAVHEASKCQRLAGLQRLDQYGGEIFNQYMTEHMQYAMYHEELILSLMDQDCKPWQKIFALARHLQNACTRLIDYAEANPSFDTEVRGIPATIDSFARIVSFFREAAEEDADLQRMIEQFEGALSMFDRADKT